MSVTDEQKGALTGAAISAATVAAAYALKHALDRSGGPRSAAERERDEDDPAEDDATAAPVPSPLLAALQEVGRQRLRSTFEDAVRHAGRSVGEKAPELERNPFVRRFLQAFSDAAARRGSRGAAG
jgi:hypothetical protein